MFLILSKILVFVSSLTKSALVENGEQRSPKKAPERMAPPRSSGLAPAETPMAMQMTPMVAAVPNEVPVSTESAQFNRNETSRITSGRKSFAAWQMINGIVPQARHRAVIIPIRTNTIRMFLAVRMPEMSMERIFFGGFPFFNVTLQEFSHPLQVVG